MGPMISKTVGKTVTKREGRLYSISVKLVACDILK